jgi:hypothetical protein
MDDKTLTTSECSYLDVVSVKNLLLDFKNNSSKLWSLLNSMIRANKSNSIAIAANDLNDFLSF